MRSGAYAATEGADLVPRARGGPTSPQALRCRRKFLRYFPDGFRDATYVDWERDYKWQAHRRWDAALGRAPLAALLRARRYDQIAALAIGIESRTNLLFSFEKMALRDAVRTPAGAQAFARGLHAFLHGEGELDVRFDAWRDTVAGLPRRQTRVLTWPVLTVFPFIAQPTRHLYLKPLVTRRAAERYGFAFDYRSSPTFATYRSLLEFGRQVRSDLRDLHPRDQIDVQSFIWVQGSDEYP